MIIGAKRIIEIIEKQTDGESFLSFDNVKEIKTICERWIDIQENDGDPVDAHSLANVVLRTQSHFSYNRYEGLDITTRYVASTARAAFIAQIQDDDEKESIPEGILDIERNIIKIDSQTAISMAHHILGDKKPKVTVIQNDTPVYLEIMDNLHKIIKGQQETISRLVEEMK